MPVDAPLGTAALNMPATSVVLQYEQLITILSCHRHTVRASDFPFQKKQFSVSKKGKFRFDSVSLLATLNSMKSQ